MTIALVLLTLASRISVAYFLATDAPGDGAIYSQLAKNILEQNVYSLDTAAPFSPTLIRLPGYPLFLAAVYTVFGYGSDTAVCIIQAVLDTLTCLITSLIAFLWTENEEKKRRSAFWTFVLISLCPFIVIYTATLLTETLTTFLMAALTLTATVAFKSLTSKKSFLWWILTGLLAGFAVLLRPDSGLFALGIGLTLVISGLFLKTENAPKFLKRLLDVVWKGAVFSIVFLLVLAPWTIRNYKLFGVFQPLAPAHAEMPGEFVPRNYERWLRTWIDESHYIEPMLWRLDLDPISVSKIPASAFDSDEERAQVAALLEQYNNPPGVEQPKDSAKSDDHDPDNSDDGADSSGDKSDDSADKSDDSSDDNSDDDDDDENVKHIAKMTPEVDAGFAPLADARIARAPLRYYFFLPVKRAAALWFDSHSVYYPFGGQMSPIKDLDYDEHQQYWLPVFTLVMWIYTLLAVGGVLYFWRNRFNKNTLRWFILLALMTLPRILFLSTIENPEPRYVVELFVFAAILGGFYLGNMNAKNSESSGFPAMVAPPSNRLLSLDVFRGITIAGMTLVNNPGTWDAIYSPLEHAEWHGATPTDWIFPFFLFIVGISITFTLGRRVAENSVGRAVYFKIFKRAFLLFAIGVLLGIFPFYNPWSAEWFDPGTMRILGVLQRIGICYLVASLIFLHTNWKQQAFIAVVILFVYWALMTLINVPGCEITTFNDKACNLAAYLDRLVLTENHTWRQSKVFDPEGVLSTLPAISTTLAGILTGHWLKSNRGGFAKFKGMILFGVPLIVAGLVWNIWFPLNKALWTGSYVVYMAGVALVFLGICYWLIDLKGFQKWSKPFQIFGANAIALYIGSTMMAIALDVIQVPKSNGELISLQGYIFNNFFLPFAEPVNASLMFAISFVLIWLFLMWLLYRRRIFLKI